MKYFFNPVSVLGLKENAGAQKNTWESFWGIDERPVRVCVEANLPLRESTHHNT